MGHSSHYLDRVLFTYSLSHLTHSEKIRFYYALKGRDGKSGVVREYHIRQLGKTVLLVPSPFDSDVESFLKIWKCSMMKKRVMIEP
ncbi:MAG TPA: hypothetical protein VJH37_00805 [Candidatus Nanoarchaeia archaeon]|nr:hypothetical protein [Candidatus Nanoarchaeia archaeon]